MSYKLTKIPQEYDQEFDGLYVRVAFSNGEVTDTSFQACWQHDTEKYEFWTEGSVEYSEIYDGVPTHVSIINQQNHPNPFT